MDNECDRRSHLPIPTSLLTRCNVSDPIKRIDSDCDRDPIQTIANQTTTPLIMAIIQIT